MALFGNVRIPGCPDMDNLRLLDRLPIPFIRQSHRIGMAIDPPYFASLSSKFEAEMAELERDIANYIPPDRLHLFAEKSSSNGDEEEDEQEGRQNIDLSAFNAGSPEQIGKLLFEILNIGGGRDLKKTAAGR